MSKIRAKTKTDSNFYRVSFDEVYKICKTGTKWFYWSWRSFFREIHLTGFPLREKNELKKKLKGASGISQQRDPGEKIPRVPSVLFFDRPHWAWNRIASNQTKSVFKYGVPKTLLKPHLRRCWHFPVGIPQQDFCLALRISSSVSFAVLVWFQISGWKYSDATY